MSTETSKVGERIDMYIKFLDSNKIIECTVVPNGNVVTLKFPKNVIVDTSGFRAFLDKEGEYDISGDSYENFTTVYRNDEETAKYNGYQLSNDGSVYVPPKFITTFISGSGGTVEGATKQEVSDYSELIIPNTVPDENYIFTKWSPEIPDSGEIIESRTFTALFEYVLTLEEIKESKVAEMNAAQQAAIQQGIDVTLVDGTVEHFTLTDHDQTSLMGLQTQVAQGAEQIPWHTSDTTEHCKYYSNADMLLIVTSAMQYVTFHVTYFRDLRIYINAMEDKESVEAVTYGVHIPEEYQSEVLRDLYAAMEG